ncbi:hypothetical protein MBRA1_001578 [Malassezia brasiliensis]|uniref:C-CAP/cofactor C-like domain-containing protein n=1 Tax=Malassezia brasiliensis TaxID=1821822 RepID=A0AAF0DRQ4_9BASI|nr:hypothetical protein MBRA1_001578 [Malassezia brasiliensis]
MANAAASSAFFATFPRELQALRRLVETELPEKSSVAVQALADARRTLQDAAPTLPAHDRQSYEHELQSIQRALAQHTQASRKRFQFRRTGAPAPTAASVPAPAAAALPSQFGVRHTTMRLGAQDVAQASGTLVGLDTCIVDLRGTAVPTLRLRNVANSLVFLGDVQGSVFVEQCTRCLITGQAHQFRAIDVHDCALLVATPSSLTLEASDQIRVGSDLFQPPAEPPHVQDFQDASASRPMG